VVRPPYLSVYRLASVAAQHWGAIDGEASSRGVNLLALSFDSFVNAIYWWAINHVRDVDQFLYELERNDTGERGRVTEADLDADAAAFMAFAGALGVAPRIPVPVEPSAPEAPALESADVASEG
jgi:hypothetical protein